MLHNGTSNGASIVAAPSSLVGLLSSLVSSISSPYTNGRLDSLSLDEIDSTRQLCNQLCQALDVARNSKMPVNTVINDVLYNIFVMSVYTSITPGRTALDISHVCHHWRNFALESPALWGFMDPSRSRISGLFLERSAKSPIRCFNGISVFDHRNSMIGVSSRPCSPDDMIMVVKAIPRIKSLTLFVDVSEARLFLQSVTNASASLLLDSLTIDVSLPRRTANDGDLPTAMTHVPRELIPDDNVLKDLTLYNIIIPWNNPPVRRLRKLVIIKPCTSPTLSQILFILDSSPGLEELGLANVSNPDTTDLNYVKEILLPRLSKLHCEALNELSLRYIQALVRKISTPALRSLRIVSGGRNSNLLNLHPFLFLPRESDSILKELTHMYICRTISHGYYSLSGRFLAGKGSVSPLFKAPWELPDKDSGEEDFRVSGQVSVRGNVPSDLSFLTQYIQMARNIQRLELNADSWEYLDPASGVDLASIMPNLSVLELFGDYKTPFPDIKYTRIGSLVPPRNISLRHLSLHRISLGMDALISVVSLSGIQYVHLHGCSGATSEEVEALRKVPVEVLVTERTGPEYIWMLGK